MGKIQFSSVRILCNTEAIFKQSVHCKVCRFFAFTFNMFEENKALVHLNGKCIRPLYQYREQYIILFNCKFLFAVKNPRASEKFLAPGPCPIEHLAGARVGLHLFQYQNPSHKAEEEMKEKGMLSRNQS